MIQTLIRVFIGIFYHNLIKIRWLILARYKFKNTDIHPTNFFLYKDIIDNKIHIWEYTYIWPNWSFYPWNNHIYIWKYCSIADDVYIITYNHSTKYISSHINQYSHKIPINHKIKQWDIVIWNDVWIWHNCTILSWVTVWNWAVIWAWAVVTKDVPPYAIVCWNPAKVVKYRFSDDTIKYIENLKWYDWDLDRIKKNKNLFNKIMN